MRHARLHIAAIAMALAGCGGDDALSSTSTSTSMPTPLSTAFAATAATAPQAKPAQAARSAEHATSGTTLNAAALDAIAPGAIDWAPCPELASVECGVLRLPVDYRQPHGASFGLGVMRARGTNPAKRIGALFINNGGPGASAIDFVFGGIAAKAPIIDRLRERFDLVAFDPRGATRSNPVACRLPLEPIPPGADAAARAAFLDDYGKRWAQACLESGGAFVHSLSLDNTVRDMEMLRRALGEPTISFAGVSYGTLLGGIYASTFPRRMRAMVLDAGVTPETRGGALLDFWTEHLAGFEFALRNLDVRCREDARCALRDTGVVAAYDEVSARLKQQPVEVEGLRLDHPALADAVSEALYSERRWPSIVSALHGAQRGDHALLASLVKASTPGSGATIATLCGSYATRLPALEVMAIDATHHAAYPRFADLAYAPLGVAARVAACNTWPAAEPTPVRNLARVLANPPLVIANDFDPATPPAWSRRLSEALGFGGAVLRYRGGGHGVATSGHPCVDDAIVSYLAGLELPPAGSTCAAMPLRF